MSIQRGWNDLWVKVSEVGKVKGRSSYRARIPALPTPMVLSLSWALKSSGELEGWAAQTLPQGKQTRISRSGPQASILNYF